MVQLGKAGRHLSASRPRSCNDNEWTCRLDIVILSVTFIADDKRNVARIAVDLVVTVYFKAKLLQFVFELLDRRCVNVAGNYDTADIESAVSEYMDQAQYIQIVCNAQIVADLVLCDISGIDGDDDLCLVSQLHEHAELAVRLEARKYTGCMVIIVQLAAKFQI